MIIFFCSNYTVWAVEFSWWHKVCQAVETVNKVYFHDKAERWTSVVSNGRCNPSVKKNVLECLVFLNIGYFHMGTGGRIRKTTSVSL